MSWLPRRSPSLEPGMTAPISIFPTRTPTMGLMPWTSAARGEHGTIWSSMQPLSTSWPASVASMPWPSDIGCVGFVSINSNDPVVYENDSWEHMVKRADGGASTPTCDEADRGWQGASAPSLLAQRDESCTGAAWTTPQGSRPGDRAGPPDALTAMLDGQAPAVNCPEHCARQVESLRHFMSDRWRAYGADSSVRRMVPSGQVAAASEPPSRRLPVLWLRRHRRDFALRGISGAHISQPCLPPSW